MTVSRYTNGRAFVVEAILNVLAEEGPMTRSAICRAIGRDRDEIASVVSRLNKKHPKLGKRVYICKWVYDDDVGRMGYPRAVYALGSKDNATKPKPKSGAEKTRVWREATKMRVASVFDLGLTTKQRIAKVRINLKQTNDQA